MSGARTEPIRRTLLQKAAIQDLPGWETRLYLLEYGAGVSAPAHHHTAAGVGYVLAGSVESTFDGGASETFNAGDSFTDLAEITHTTSANRSATEPLHLLIAYTVRSDEPVTITP